MNLRSSISDLRSNAGTCDAVRDARLHRSHIADRRSQIAFTLVELLVVIGIIAVLLGLGLLVGPAVIGKGNEQVTRSLLNNCNAILAVYQTRVGSPVNNYGSNPIDWGTSKDRNKTGDTGSDVSLAINTSQTTTTAADYPKSFYNLSIEQFVYATYKIDSIKTGLYAGAVMKNGSTSLLGDLDGNGMLDIRDAWDNKIVYVANNPNPGSDGFAHDDKLPARSTPYFASAGRDGKWGNVGGTQAEKDQAADNLYSYDAN